MKSWEQKIFFFMSGAYSLYAWNSILNLNGYFETEYNDPHISKQYAFFNMLMGCVAIFVSYFVGKHFDHLTVARNSFLTIFVIFHLMYVNTELVSSIFFILFFKLFFK